MSGLNFLLRTLRKGVLVLGVAPLLAACGEKAPEATDEQLLKLLASDSAFLGADRPLSLARHTVECVRVLSGLDGEIYKDMPAEMLGVMKTKCRQEFDKRLKDEAKNPMGFQLVHFESKALAERVSKLKETTDAANRQAAQERRQRQEQAARAKVERDLGDLRSRYAAFVASLDARLQGARPLCDEWIATREALKKKDKRTNWSYRQPSALCADDIARIQAAAAKHLEALNAAEVKGRGTFFSFPRPYFGNASPEWFDKQVEKLTEEIRQMKTALAT